MTIKKSFFLFTVTLWLSSAGAQGRTEHSYESYMNGFNGGRVAVRTTDIIGARFGLCFGDSSKFNTESCTKCATGNGRCYTDTEWGNLWWKPPYENRFCKKSKDDSPLGAVLVAYWLPKASMPTANPKFEGEKILLATSSTFFNYFDTSSAKRDDIKQKVLDGLRQLNYVNTKDVGDWTYELDSSHERLINTSMQVYEGKQIQRSEWFRIGASGEIFSKLKIGSDENYCLWGDLIPGSREALPGTARSN